MGEVYDHNGIDFTMQEKGVKKYLNLMPQYIERLKQAVRDGKWIMKQGSLIDPLEFINVYGRSWMMNADIELQDPDEVIRQFEGRELTPGQQARFDEFKARLANYRAMNLDALIIEALDTNFYVAGLDPEYRMR